MTSGRRCGSRTTSGNPCSRRAITYELLLVVAEFLTEEEERRPAPEDIADSLRVDPARPLLNELEDEGLVVDPEFLKEEEPLLRPPV